MKKTIFRGGIMAAACAAVLAQVPASASYAAEGDFVEEARTNVCAIQGYENNVMDHNSLQALDGTTVIAKYSHYNSTSGQTPKNSICAVNTNGAKVWQIVVDSNGQAGGIYHPLVLASGNVVYEDRGAGKIVLVGPNGTEKWRTSTESGPDSNIIIGEFVQVEDGSFVVLFKFDSQSEYYGAMPILESDGSMGSQYYKDLDALNSFTYAASTTSGGGAFATLTNSRVQSLRAIQYYNADEHTGTQAWSSTLSTSLNVLDMDMMGDRALLFSGVTTENMDVSLLDGASAFLVKYDREGNLVFGKEYDVDNQRASFFRNATELSDGNIVAVGGSQDQDNKETARIVRINGATGDIIGSLSYSNSRFDGVVQVGDKIVAGLNEYDNGTSVGTGYDTKLVIFGASPEQPDEPDDPAPVDPDEGKDEGKKEEKTVNPKTSTGISAAAGIFGGMIAAAGAVLAIRRGRR